MAAREFSLSFEVAPPTSVRPGQAFTLPVVVSIRPIGTPSRNVQALAVHASLRDETGSGAAPGLGGSLTSSVRDGALGGYAKFGPLTISRPGKYRLRVMLGAASYNGVVTKEFVDSGLIIVGPTAPAAQRPTATQVATLQRLTAQKLDITSADIAKWQTA
ncbi:hypothetical protein N7488_002567 [Penicillium malachiteum]|nr:hypothetical protein N7488_002567 [Penicillium malachiteum]